MALIPARDRLTELIVYDNQTNMIDNTNGTVYTDGVVDGTQRLEYVKFRSLPGFGEVNSAMYRCDITGTTDLTGKYIRVRYSYYATDSATTRTSEWLFAGKIDSCKYDRQRIARSLVAYDKMYELRSIDISDWWLNYWNTATGDKTMYDVTNALLIAFNVPFLASMFRNNITILKDAQKGRKLGGCSIANFLTCVGLISGIYWYVTPNGRLFWNTPNISSNPMDFDAYVDSKNTEIGDSDLSAYGTFTVYDGADIIYTSGTGEPTYTFANNFLLYGHTTASLVSILDTTKTYLDWFVEARPATIESIVSQPFVDSSIKVSDSGGSRKCYITKKEMWGAQLINQRLTCTGDRVIGTQYSSALNRAANEIQKIGTELTYKVNADNVIEAVNLEAQGGVQIKAEAIDINGVVSANDGFKVNLDGSMEAVAGLIGGWTIGEDALYKEVTINGYKYRVKLNTDITPDEMGERPAVVVQRNVGSDATPIWKNLVSMTYDGRMVFDRWGSAGASIKIDQSGLGDETMAISNDCMQLINNLEIGNFWRCYYGNNGIVIYQRRRGLSTDTEDVERTASVSSDMYEVRQVDNEHSTSAYSRLSIDELVVNSKDILRTHQSLVGGWFLRGTITSNSDLNTGAYCKVGRWSCSTAVANTLRNTPVYTEFVMTVRAATQTGDLGDESGTWTYRIREIETWNGIKYRQQCSTQGTAGVWTFGAWYLDGASAINGTLTANTGSFSESHCRQAGRVVDIHAWLASLSTSTQSHSNAIKVTGVSLPPVPVRFVCTCWLGNGIASYAGYGVLDTYGNISLVKGVANSDKVSFAISYVV